MIFCRTKRRVTKLYEVLKSNGFDCDQLHGDLSQSKREQVMKRFRDAEIQLLVATDVAARGLDVEGVTHVFNYDIPLDPESYVHRIGRTGRAGMKGLAITFYSSADKPLLEAIEKGLKISIPKQNLGNSKDDIKPEASSEKRGRIPNAKPPLERKMTAEKAASQNQKKTGFPMKRQKRQKQFTSNRPHQNSREKEAFSHSFKKFIQ